MTRGSGRRASNRLGWPASFRNGGRHQIGTVAGFKSESVAGLRRNSHLLLRAAQGLLGQLENSGYHLQMRIGAHSGYWRLNQELEGIEPELRHRRRRAR